MADILIRSVEIPERSDVIVQIFSDGKATLYPFLGEPHAVEIVELPEHGDLIDRDALGEAPTYYGSHCDLDDVEDWINSEPVVIPSNKEDAE